MNSLLLRPIIPTRKLSRNVRNSVFWWKSLLRKCHFVTYLVKCSNAFPLLWSAKFDPKWEISFANQSKGTFFQRKEKCVLRLSNFSSSCNDLSKFDEGPSPIFAQLFLFFCKYKREVRTKSSTWFTPPAASQKRLRKNTMQYVFTVQFIKFNYIQQSLKSCTISLLLSCFDKWLSLWPL